MPGLAASKRGVVIRKASLVGSILGAALLGSVGAADAASPAPPAATAAATTAADSAGGATATVAGFELRVKSIDYNDQSGDFKIPDRFTATRNGTEIIGDHASGNSRTEDMQVVGNVVIHQSQPVQPSGDLSSLGKEPATLTCDKLTVDGKQKVYTAIGHVHYTQGTHSATAERGSLNETTHQLHMEGRVHMQDGQQTIDADSVDYDTMTGSGHAQGNVIMRGPAESTGILPPPRTPKPKPTPRPSKPSPTPAPSPTATQ